MVAGWLGVESTGAGTLGETGRATICRAVKVGKTRRDRNGGGGSLAEGLERGRHLGWQEGKERRTVDGKPGSKLGWHPGAAGKFSSLIAAHHLPAGLACLLAAASC